jgi:ATP-dependent Clp protease protease subunit
MIPEITIYGPIGGDDENAVTTKMVSDSLASIGEDVPEINVRINSDGGSVSQGVAIANLLKRHPAKINTIVEGGAFSIAGFIACSGDRRSICSDAVLHIHGPHTSTQGNLEDHEDSLKELQIATKVMGERYAEVSGQDFDAVVSNFHRDQFFDAQEAVAAGFMTEVIGDAKVAALVDSSQFERIPGKFAAALAGKTGPEPHGEDKIMSTKQTAAASVKAMRSQFKRASAEFLLKQVEDEASMDDAMKAYVAAMEEENEELKSSLQAMEEKLSAMDTETEAEESEEDVIAQLKAELAQAQAMEEETEAEDEEEEVVAEEDEEVMALKAEVAALKEQLAPKPEKKKRRGSRRKFGAKAIRKSSGTSGQVARQSAKAEVDRQVADLMKSRNMTKRDAVLAVYKSNPDLQARMIDEANS